MTFFEYLRPQIKHAAKKAFLEIVEQHKDEKIYAFALYSDGGAMTVCPSTNTLDFLDKKDKNDFLYYKYEPAEWKYESEGAEAEFDKICKELCKELDKLPDDEDSFETFQTTLFQTCVDVLEELRNDNFFKKIIGEEIFLLFSVSDSLDEEELIEIVNRLNSQKYATEYAKIFNE